MSQRHRSPEVAPPRRLELRAHAHHERHRIKTELQAVAAQVSAGLAPEDVHEPGPGWVPEAPRDAERAIAAGQPVTKHWKLKMWKRRTNLRLARAQAFRLAGRDT